MSSGSSVSNFTYLLVTFALSIWITGALPPSPCWGPCGLFNHRAFSIVWKARPKRAFAWLRAQRDILLDLSFLFQAFPLGHDLTIQRITLAEKFVHVDALFA